jgi:hypothetical protein
MLPHRRIDCKCTVNMYHSVLEWSSKISPNREKTNGLRSPKLFVGMRDPVGLLFLYITVFFFGANGPVGRYHKVA